MGAIIGALFVQFTTYHWIFYFITILAVPSAIVCILLIPGQEHTDADNLSPGEKLRNLDMVGVTTLTGTSRTVGEGDAVANGYCSCADPLHLRGY